MKKTIAFLGLLVFVLLVTGCGKKSLEGAWKLTNSNCNDELSSLNLSINMNDNENGMMYKDAGELLCTITVKDDKFICTSSSGENTTYDYEVDDYNINLSRNECAYKYFKQMD